MKKLIGVAFISILFFSGCNLMENKKLGVRCDDPDAIKLAESIFNENILENEAEIKIDTNNIIIWDYKPVGRYLCRAKISGKLKPKNKYLPWGAENYGIYEENKTIKGWIYYKTYMSTKDLKNQKEDKPYTFYVEITQKKDINTW